MPLEKFESTKPYVTIIDGTLKQKVNKNTEGAVLREYELKDGTKGSKYELTHRAIRGYINDISLKEGKFGQTLDVDFGDCILSMNTDSRYFGDFAKKIMSADITKEIQVIPFDFVGDKGKPIKGVTIYNDGAKMVNHYWNAVDSKACNGIPQPVGNTEKFSNDDWKVYFIGVKKFLIEELKTIMDKVEANKDNIPTINPPSLEKDKEEIPVIDADEDVDIKIEDIPF